MFKLKVIYGGREIEIEFPYSKTMDSHTQTLEILKETVKQIKELNV